MNKYKLLSFTLLPIIFVFSVLAYISYTHSSNANQLHHQLTHIGHELIAQRDVIVNPYAQERNEEQLYNELAKSLRESEALMASFQSFSWFNVSDAPLQISQYLETFHRQLRDATAQLSGLSEVQIAKQSALDAIHALYKAQYPHEDINSKLGYFEFLEELLLHEGSLQLPEMKQLWMTVSANEQQTQQLTEQVLDHHFIEFVEQNEHELLDLVQHESLLTVLYVLGAIMAILAMFFLQTLQRVQALNTVNADLIQTTDKAERALKAKAQFLATMSHELRTPMNGVLGISQVVASETREASTKSNMQVILDSGQHLMTILNDLLDFSKLEEHKMVFEALPFRVGQILGPVISAAQPLADEKNIKLIINNSVSNDIEFIGDCSRIRQVIFNLVGNAIKFTSEGHVTVNVQLNKMSNKLSVAVKDTGIGIPNQLQEKVFNSFEQADASTTRKFGGTGLGLAIVKKLVEQMEGAIRVQSVEGIGSEFIVTLPLVWNKKPQAAKQVSSGQMPVRSQNRPLKILLAEDNKVNAIVAKKFCEKMGHTIELAEHGMAAIKKLKQQHYDLILMDNHMPQMNGITATRYIREELGLKTVLFAYTADVFREAHDGFIDAGADHVLTKPLQKDSFLDALELFAVRLDQPELEHEMLISQEHLTSNVVPLRRNPIEKLRLTEEELTNSPLLEALKEDAESLTELLQSVISDFEQTVDAIIEQFIEGDLSALATSLHTTKGMALNLGLEILSNQAAELEHLTREQQSPDPEHMQKLVNRLSVNIHQGQRLLGQLVSSNAKVNATVQ